MKIRTRPFVYFFVFAWIHHLAPQLNWVSFYEVINVTNIKKSFEIDSMTKAWGSCKWQFWTQTLTIFFTWLCRLCLLFIKKLLKPKLILNTAGFFLRLQTLKRFLNALCAKELLKNRLKLLYWSLQAFFIAYKNKSKRLPLSTNRDFWIGNKKKWGAFEKFLKFLKVEIFEIFVIFEIFYVFYILIIFELPYPLECNPGVLFFVLGFWVRFYSNLISLRLYLSWGSIN